ncbi:hypothetical protein DFH06DRAFT_1289597 [Mycena polygramma]|nr:hypothetical protein DFH06DRAFT_1289597 [Mycena polygramma]
MFSNSSGFQFIGNNSDLVVRGPDEPALAASTLENVPAAGAHRYLGHALQNYDAASLLPVFAALELDPAQGSQREAVGVVRNSCRAMAVRPALYDAASPSSRHLLHDEEGRGLSSLRSNVLHSEVPISSPDANLDCPLQPYPDRNDGPQSEYPSIHPNSDDAMGSHQYHAHEEHRLPNLRPVLPHPQSLQGNFFSAQHIINGQHVNNHGESGINILHRAVALEALFDSADSSADGFPQPKCHPETRKEMVDNLYNWVVDDDPSQPLHWLHGPAGAGKSAIMRTLCELLQKSRRLGGAFFFKREHMTRGNAKVLRLKALISQSVEADPSVVGREMDVQLKKLIIEPCQALPDSAPTILLIDGYRRSDLEGTMFVEELVEFK